MARAAEWCMDDFHTQNLANTAWAYATVGQSDPQLFMAWSGQAACWRLQCTGACQHSMSIRHGRQVGCSAVQGFVEGSRPAPEGFQCAGHRQRSMGMCDGGPVGCTTVYEIGPGSTAAHGRLQRTGARKHSMGVFRRWVRQMRRCLGPWAPQEKQLSMLDRLRLLANRI